MPFYTIALGKVFLAHLPEPKLVQFLDRWPITKGARGKTGRLELEKEPQQARAQGFSMVRFEAHNESCSLAAPIFDASETVNAAVSVSCRRHLAIWNDEQVRDGRVQGSSVGDFAKALPS